MAGDFPADTAADSQHDSPLPPPPDGAINAPKDTLTDSTSDQAGSTPDARNASTGGVIGTGGTMGTGGAAGGTVAGSGGAMTGGSMGGVSGTAGAGGTAGSGCLPPAVPAGLSAIRSGNKQVTLVWTNSTGATSYNVVRSDGYSVRTTAGSPYVENTATNGTAFSYAMSAASDTSGLCSSANSGQVAVPACTVWASGTHSQQLSNNISEWCVVTCADISSGSGYANPINCGNRTSYFNGAQVTCGSQVSTPAKANGGYAFHFTAGTAVGSDGYVGVQIGNVVADTSCP